MGDRKGKAKMTQGELDLEDWRKGQLERARNDYGKTEVSRLIRKISPSRGIDDWSRFSWRFPGFHGFEGWPRVVDGDGGLLYAHDTYLTGPHFPPNSDFRSNPVPDPVCQGGEPTCLAHSVYHVLMLQMAIVSRYLKGGIPCPSISLTYLSSLPSENPHVFFNALKAYGVYQSSEYDDLNHQPKTDEPSFSIVFPTTFTGESLSLQEYGIAICRAIVECGGVVIGVPSYDHNGKRCVETVRSVVEGEVKFKCVNVNHALCCVEWEQRSDGTYGFVCIDSGTGEFCMRWLENIDSILRVYIVQLGSIDSVRKVLRDRIKAKIAKLG